MLKKIILFFNCIFIFTLVDAQIPKFTHQDTLRGSITKEREWWDLTYYHLNVKVNIKEHALTGENEIYYKVLKSSQTMQIDLQPPMQITKVLMDSIPLNYKRDGNAYFIDIVAKQNIGDINHLTVYYDGKPHVSKRPPWEGGITWKKDNNGKDFISTTCQGDGASLWWPCKDHMYDKPDSMLISVTIPEPLMNVSNGRLRSLIHNADSTNTSNWFVSNPISNYCVNINIGDYVHFSEVYKGEDGALDCNYFVLRDNLEKAKKQFKEVPRMLEAFEHWFGPYPFYKDGYKLVEVTYPGMEHQSSVTYGNGFENGYGGRDVSHTGLGMKFDFIIVHESGHEWFANNITYKDIADMWIHESFTAYSENLFLNYFFDKQASADYVIGTRANIRNDKPIIGFYNVNNEGSGDMYYKGANMLHTLRQIVNDDEKWRNILRGLNKEFYHQTVTSAQIENYMSKAVGIDLSKVFDQYLRDARIPVLEYTVNNKKFKYRWTNCVAGFNMSVKLFIDNKIVWFSPTENWQDMSVENDKVKVEAPIDFYIKTKVMTK